MKHPSPNARVAPIGTRYSPPLPLTEQRSGGTYHERMPWPGDHMSKLQTALLRKPAPSPWRFVLAWLAAFVTLALASRYLA